MQRTEHETYIRNRNFITAVFAGYLRLVKWLAIIILSFCGIAIVLLMIGQLFGPTKPVIVGKPVYYDCEQTTLGINSMWTKYNPDYKSCKQEGMGDQRFHVKMSDWEWAELQDDG